MKLEELLFFILCLIASTGILSLILFTSLLYKIKDEVEDLRRELKWRNIHEKQIG